ncbi:MAG: putative porin [Parahaliea sp.]
MFKKIAMASSIGFVLAGTAHADYRWELGGGYASGDIDSTAADADSDTFGIQGKYFLDNVDTSKGPLGEAEFLDRASFIGLEYRNGEIDVDGADELDTESYGVNARLVHKPSGWLANMSYRVDEYDDQDLDSYAFGVGKYLGDNTTLTMTYEHLKMDDFDEIKSDLWGMDFAHMFRFNNGTALKMDAGYAYVDSDEGDSGDQYKLGGTYYLNDRLGFGASYERLALDEDYDTWKVYADWFVNEKVSVTLSYGETDTDYLDFNNDGFLVGVNMRF